MLKRKLWTNFDLGQRFQQEAGRLDDPRVQMGFEELSNILIEDGLLRKRPGSVTAVASDSNWPLQSLIGLLDNTKLYKFENGTITGTAHSLAIKADQTTFPESQHNENDLVSYWTPDTTPVRYAHDFVKLHAIRDQAGNHYPINGVFAKVNGRRVFARGDTIVSTRTNRYLKYLGTDNNNHTDDEEIKEDGLVVYNSNPGSYTVPAYNSSTTYITGDVVSSSGAWYVCKLPNNNSAPKNPSAEPSYWQPIEPYGNIPVTADYSIDLTLPEVGTIVWIVAGASVFIGTTTGVYELASSYPYGISPEVGGVVPRLVHPNSTYLGSLATRDQVWADGKISTVFRSNPDEVTLFSKYSKQGKGIRIPLSKDEVIHSIAYYGGSKFAILIAPATAFNTASLGTYNPSGNYILLLDENTLSFSRVNFPAGYIRSGKNGLYVKYKYGTDWKASFIPYLGDWKYQGNTSDYQDKHNTDVANVASRIVTMPIHVGSALGSDLNSPKVIKKVVVRVYETKSLKVWVRTTADDGTVTNHPAQSWSSTNYVSTDIEFFSLDSVHAPRVQLVIENDLNESFNVLAIQADIEVGEQ